MKIAEANCACPMHGSTETHPSLENFQRRREIRNHFFSEFFLIRVINEAINANYYSEQYLGCEISLLTAFDAALHKSVFHFPVSL